MVEESIPLLNDFLKLNDMDIARRAYAKYRGVFPDDGMASKKGLRRAADLAGIAREKSIDHIFDWSILKEARAELNRPRSSVKSVASRVRTPADPGGVLLGTR